MANANPSSPNVKDAGKDKAKKVEGLIKKDGREYTETKLADGTIKTTFIK